MARWLLSAAVTDIGPDRQVTAETLLLASPPETAAEVAPSQYAAHAFVGFPEERPRNSAGISSGPERRCCREPRYRRRDLHRAMGFPSRYLRAPHPKPTFPVP